MLPEPAAGRTTPTTQEPARLPHREARETGQVLKESLAMTDTDHQQRAAYIDGLRQLADLLDSHPEVPLPYTGLYSAMHWIVVTGDNQRETVAAIARALPGRKDKNVTSDGTTFSIDARLAGLSVGILADRDTVCERRVVGVETVEVPATPAQPALPARVVEREVVEWDCRPILAGGTPEQWDRLMAAVDATATGGA